MLQEERSFQELTWEHDAIIDSSSDGLFVCDGQLTLLGAPRSRKVDVFILAVTDQDLEQMIRGGRFRLDLYYCLSAIPSISLPCASARNT